MPTTLALDIPDNLMERLTTLAEQEFRTPEAHILWLIKNATEPSTLRHGNRLRNAAPLFTDLRRLHLAVGAPSTRAVAKKIEERTAAKISHTTVHATLRGTIFPSWAVLEKIVRVLGGDVDHYRRLWMNAQK